MSGYPPAPWRLGGWGVATVGLVDAAAARATAPQGADIVCVAPGRTIGGLFFLAYERGPITYRELNIVAGLARVGTRFAFWVPRLYVDSEASLAGGREIWGVPKELAAFDITHEIGATAIAVTQGRDELCRLRASVSTSGLRLPLPMPAFGIRGAEFLFFTGRLDARIALVRAVVTMPRDGEFAPLGLDRPRFAARAEGLTLAVPAPRVVRRAAPIPESVYGTS